MERFAEIAASYGVPEQLRPLIAPDAPSRGKIPIARGLLPAPPKVQIAMAYLLVGDPDPEIAEAARSTLIGMPPRLVADAIGPDTPEKILEFFAFHSRDLQVLEKVVLQRQVSDRTLCYLAEVAPERIVEIIAGNQERLLICPELYLHLRANPATPRSVLDRVAAFQRMCGIDLTRMELEAGAPAPAPAPEERRQPEPAAPAEPEDPLAAVLAEFGVVAQGAAPAQAAPATPAPASENADGGTAPAHRPEITVDGEILRNLTPLADSTFTFGYEGDGEEWDEDLIRDHGDHVDEDLIRSIVTKLSKMTTGQKIKLAYVGNKEVRELLVRERNKMVATAVVKSGRLTEPEVLKICQNRSIVDDVLRLIAGDREWLRRYPIKVALVNNPKCPLPVAMSLISSLQLRDLKQLANNRNVSSAVFTAAQKLLRERKQS